MNPPNNQHSHEERNLYAVNLGFLFWHLTVLAAYVLMLAALGVFYPVIRSQIFHILTFTSCVCFPLLVFALQISLTNPWTRIIAWLLLSILIVPQLVLLIIFGFPMMWPPH